MSSKEYSIVKQLIDTTQIHPSAAQSTKSCKNWLNIAQTHGSSLQNVQICDKPEEKAVFESLDVSRIIKSMHTKYRENKNFIEIQNTVNQSDKFQSLTKSNDVKADFILVLFYLLYTLQTGKLLAQKKHYRAKRILSFP